MLRWVINHGQTDEIAFEFGIVVIGFALSDGPWSEVNSKRPTRQIADGIVPCDTTIVFLPAEDDFKVSGYGLLQSHAKLGESLVLIAFETDELKAKCCTPLLEVFFDELIQNTGAFSLSKSDFCL